MAINTGPDSNKYEIPEVVVSNTFNTWKDLSNLNTYKLNKLRVYSGLSGDSIGLSTAETNGVLTAVLLPTVITGHTFSAGIKGTTAAFNALNAYGTGLVIGSNATAITMGVAGGSANILSNVTITGNLNVTGTRTQTSSADFVIADSVISLGQTGSVGVTGAIAHAQDRGIAFFYPDTATSIGASLGFFGPKAGSRNFVYLLNGSTSGTNIHSGVTGTFQGNFLGGDATLEKLVVGGTLDVVGIANFRGGVTFSGGITLTVGATLSTRSSIVFSDGTTKQVGFRAPSNITTSAVWTLPVSPGSAGQVLTTDAGSTLSWTTPAVGGSNTQVLFNSSGSVSGDSGLIYTAAGGLTATKISATASLSSNSKLLVGPSVNIASNPSNTLATASIVGSAFTNDAFNATLGLYGTDGLAVGNGAGIMFGGGYTSANANLLTTWAEVSGVRENATDGLYDGALVFKTRATNVNAAERVRITSTGQVGIGTPSPTAKLHVKPANVVGATNLSGMNLLSKYSLVLDGTIANAASGISYNGAGIAFAATDTSATLPLASIFYGGEVNGGSLNFATSETYVNGLNKIGMTIYRGRVGIGITAPAVALDVVGEVKASAWSQGSCPPLYQYASMPSATTLATIPVGSILIITG